MEVCYSRPLCGAATTTFATGPLNKAVWQKYAHVLPM